MMTVLGVVLGALIILGVLFSSFLRPAPRRADGGGRGLDVASFLGASESDHFSDHCGGDDCGAFGL